MPETVAPPPLAPDAAVKFAEFARACKAAARAVALYPGTHPAIGASLSRLAQATTRLAEGGPFTLQVRSNSLLLNGALPQRPDPAIAELAEVLYRHLIGAMTVNAAADADSWRTLLLLLARTPEEVRSDGGIAKLWATAGGPSLEIVEIDYAEVLREKQGDAATIDQIIEAAIAGPQVQIDDATIQALLGILNEPEKFQQLLCPARSRDGVWRNRGQDGGISQSGPEPDRVSRQDQPGPARRHAEADGGRGSGVFARRRGRPAGAT